RQLTFRRRLVRIFRTLPALLFGVAAVGVRVLARVCPCILALGRWFWRRAFLLISAVHPRSVLSKTLQLTISAPANPTFPPESPASQALLFR
ncbi:hypothetical protein EV121DRAFT_256609, partial [Schizophyllum commune]